MPAVKGLEPFMAVGILPYPVVVECPVTNREFSTAGPVAQYKFRVPACICKQIQLPQKGKTVNFTPPLLDRIKKTVPGKVLCKFFQG